MSDQTIVQPLHRRSSGQRSGLVAVLGASGFVGRAAVAHLAASHPATRELTAPRIAWAQADPRTTGRVPRSMHAGLVDALAQELDGATVVVNAAGIANGSAPADPTLYGANALLPVLVARACALAGVKRYIHLSSAAVQGNLDLDETPRTAPFSPYSRSKALGERVLQAEDGVETVIFRSTWVHDVERPNTLSVIRVARSAASCVAGDGSAPTPQVLVGDIAASIGYLVQTPLTPPPIVLQPHNGMTTGAILELLGGRRPRHIPVAAARGIVRGSRVVGLLGTHANSYARRVEMLLWGKPQAPGWLDAQGLAPSLHPDCWQRLAATSHRRGTR